MCSILITWTFPFHQTEGFLWLKSVFNWTTLQKCQKDRLLSTYCRWSKEKKNRTDFQLYYCHLHPHKSKQSSTLTSVVVLTFIFCIAALLQGCYSERLWKSWSLHSGSQYFSYCRSRFSMVHNFLTTLPHLPKPTLSREKGEAKWVQQCCNIDPPQHVKQLEIIQCSRKAVIAHS